MAGRSSGWSVGQMDGRMTTLGLQLLSMVHEIGTWWPIATERSHTVWLYLECANIYIVTVALLFMPLWCPPVFSFFSGWPITSTQSLSSQPRIALSLRPSVINSFQSHSLLPVDITALALLCISSARFEAISVHDHYQTRPEEKVRGWKKVSQRKRK